ncbi:hypothetical protein [Vibrio aestuarianus]|uniref:hypothetical protein n=1 Tax=Vibrio aestuarianus TaxID=28171 RepID=UPI00237C64AB|nr:hypothetical protein [Vibrio aestuarianus]MDE1334202.1 hypothetical protein [Vibrio aestuarianus]
MSDREKLLVLVVGLFASFLLISFGTLIGATSFSATFSEMSWGDVLSSISAVVAAIATSIAALCAWLALSSWKSQQSWIRKQNIADDIANKLYELDRLTIHNAKFLQGCSNAKLEGKLLKPETKAKIKENEKQWEHHYSQLVEAGENWHDLTGSARLKSLLSLIHSEAMGAILMQTELVNPETNAEDFAKYGDEKITEYVLSYHKLRNEIRELTKI